MKQNTAVSFFPCLQLSLITVVMCLLMSCGTSKKVNTNYIYFRDGADTVLTHQKENIIQPNDLLSIQVSSRTLNQEQAAIFNLPSSQGSPLQGYQVNTNGNIDMPVIGAIKAAGLTKEQLQTLLVQKLTDYVKNPTVLIRFLQFNINVLGEVKNPGTQKFQVDKVTIIDALSAAGDLTDYGKREDIKVIREEGNGKVTHIIDLRNKDVFQSPVYFLQPNDIVYVSPNAYKLKNLNVDPEKQRRTGLFFTVLATMVSVATLIVLATKN